MQTIRIATAARRLPVATRAFASSARVQSGGSSHVSNNDPDVLEREKQRNLSGKQHDTSTPHKKSAPGWNESLASVSEAFVKADQAPVESPEELTRVTLEHIETRHREDQAAHAAQKTTTEHIESTTIERDEVQGPLRNAKGN